MEDFKYYQFLDFKGIVIGRPVNPHPMMITLAGLPITNNKYFLFEGFAHNLTYQVVDGIPAGLYDREDVELIQQHECDYYQLKK